MGPRGGRWARVRGGPDRRVKRGEVYLADLEPVRGSEANKARPVILVGNNASINAAQRFQRGVVTVVPCTSNSEARGAMHVALLPTRLNGLRVSSKAQAEQIRSLDIARLLRPLGKLGPRDLDAVEKALRYHLSL